MALRNNAIERVTIPTDMQVVLTDKEKCIRDLLDQCTTCLRQEKNIETSCRIAGGWVRDKLLGSQSNDIDVALSNMMGLEFAEHLAEFAARKGVRAGTISKIAKNPDQSKHLETATMKLYGLDIDLVNLRSEEYAKDSRIPTEVTFGTPEQDALRRDITINSLFYNVHTCEVEDYTRRGIDDLRQGIIRTSLAPRETFLDDPLRVIRCIRFASRYGFKMDKELEDAARDPLIQDALVMKVARERVGEEISKMMKGHNPLHSISLILSSKIYKSIFNVIPDKEHAESASIDTALAASTILETILRTAPGLPTVKDMLIEAVLNDSSCRARLYLAAALTPLKDLTYIDKKKKDHSIVKLAIRDSLKLGVQNHFLDGIPPLFKASKLLSSQVAHPQAFKYPSERVSLGILLREKCVHNSNTGSHWTTSLLFSLVQDLVPLYNVAEDIIDVERSSAIISSYNAFLDRILELQLSDAADMKPLLDGREILETFNAKPGAWVGEVMSRIVEWQLEHPERTREACIKWLHAERSVGKFSIDERSSEPASKRHRTK